MALTMIFLVILSSVTLLHGYKFLSIKLPGESSFVPICSYEKILFLLRASIAGIVLDNDDLEIIVSNSIHVKHVKEIIRSDIVYPQWKLTHLIFRDIYEGIHISKQGDDLVVHSLSMEVDDPIPFFDDSEWSAQVTGASSFGTIEFSGPSLSIVYRAIQLLFKVGVKFKIFKESCLIVNQRYSLYCNDHTANEIIKMSTKFDIFNEHLYYIEGLYDEMILYFTKDISGRYSDGHNTFFLHSLLPDDYHGCCIIGGERHFKLSTASKSVKRALKTGNDIQINGFIDMSLNNKSRSPLNHNNNNNNNQDQQEEKPIGPFSLKLIMTRIDPRKFLELFDHVFGKLIFKFPISILIIYSQSKNENGNTIGSDGSINIFLENGMFEPILMKYFKESATNHEIPNEDYNAIQLITNVIKIEDDQGHLFRYDVEKSEIFQRKDFYLLFFPPKQPIKRIILLWDLNSCKTRMKKVYTLKLTTSDPDVLAQKTKQIMNSKYSNIRGMEIIFTNGEKNRQVEINIFKEQNPKTPVSKMVSIENGFYTQWRCLLFDIRQGEIYGEKFISSYELALFFWSKTSKEMFVSIRRFNASFLDYSGASRLEIKEVKDEHLRIKLIKILLSEKLIYPIHGFRLRHEFRVIIDLVGPEDGSNLANFITKEFESSIKYKIIKDINLKRNIEIDYLPLDDEKYNFIPRLNISSNLFFSQAINLLFRKPFTIPLSPNQSVLQVIERKGDYAFAGEIRVVYHNKKMDITKQIQTLTLTHRQIVRIVRAENYGNLPFSFFFSQYSMNVVSDIRAHCSLTQDKLYVKCSFGLFVSGRELDSILDMVKNLGLNLGKIVKEELPW